MRLTPGFRVGPYEVLSVLGTGGMGEVYLADDARLDRRVAIKTLRAGDRSSAEDHRRVLREGRAAARLTHPRIAAIYDVLEADGTTYLVMEYVEGRTLRRVLRDGPLEVPRAVTIGLELCEALGVAHQNGVIHGDVKPENVCLQPDGHLKVLDFGIARLLGGVATTGHQGTSDGDAPTRFAGTPQYAAPEQFAGRPASVRADVYAAAAVCFEMLTGQTPFSGADALEIGLQATRDDPPRADRVAPAVPHAVADVLNRALARDPAHRTATAGEFAAALQAAVASPDEVGAETREMPALSPTASATQPIPFARAHWPWLAACCALLAAIVAAGVWHARATSSTGSGAPPVLAVLPLESTSTSPEHAMLGRGIADTLIATLGDSPDLVVVSRRATLRTGVPRDDLPRLARDLGASYLLDGSVQVAGDVLRVAISLVRADGSVAWGRTVEGPIARVFDLQRQLADELRERLRVQPRPVPDAVGTSGTRGPARAQGPATLDVSALSDYAAASERLARLDLAGNLALAIDGFSRALQEDPGFVLAHVGLSDAFMANYRQTRASASLDQAVAHANEAARLAPYHTETWVALGRIYAETGRLDDARIALERAISLQSAHDDAWRELGRVRGQLGDRAGAAQAFERAIALRPRYWGNHHEYGRFLFATAQYDAAAAEFRTVVDYQPDSPRGFQALGTVYQAQGRLAEAAESYRRATELSPSVNAYLNLGALQHWMGRYQEAMATYRRAAALAPEDPAPQRNIGDSLLKLGDEAGARAAYTQALVFVERERRRNATSAEARELFPVLLAKLGRHAEAGREARALAAAAPDDVGANYTLAVVLALSGATAEGCAALARAFDLGYSRELAARDDDLAGVANCKAPSPAP